MNPRHILLCHLGSGDNEQLLRRAAELCARSGADLSLVVPVVDGAMPDGCCGIDGEHWRRLTDEGTRDAAQRAVRLLEALGCPSRNVAIEAGPSLAEIAARAAERYGCDVIAIARKRAPWSSGGLSRRQLDKLRRGQSRSVLELTRT
jgi:nucleotide-binding universal stress UspA family protein